MLYGFCNYRALHDVFFLLYCLFVCLSVCQSPPGHNAKPIVMKLYQDGEVVSTEKPIDFEVNR